MHRLGIASSDLGDGPREVYRSLLPLLHIGEEGKHVFNMRQIVATVRDGETIGLRWSNDHA